MLNATPFLLFDGNCAEAMSFYRDCFGGELTLTKLGDTPMKAQMPEALHPKIAYAHLKSNTVEFSATIGCTQQENLIREIRSRSILPAD
jgi:PhnB protein